MGKRESHNLEDNIFSPSSLLLGFYLRKKELATLTDRAPELCGRALFYVQALSSSSPLCAWALCPGLVLLLSSVAGLCVQTKIIHEAVCSWGEGRAYQEIDF